LLRPQIGVLAALTTSVALVAGPMWAGLADRKHIHKRLLTSMMVLAPVAMALLAQTNQFGLLIVLVSVQAFLAAPISSLADNSVLELLGDQRHHYSRIRLWGSIGYALTALGGGYIIDKVGINAAILSYVLLMWLGAFVTSRLPPAREIHPAQLRDLGKIMTDARWIWFLVALVLVGLCSSIFNNYLALFLNRLGASTTLYGIAIVTSNLSELPIFLLAPKLVQRGQARLLLVMAFGAYALRALITSYLQDPAWAILPQMLHGLSFAALWAGCVAYVSQIAPKGWNATAQSLFGVVYTGLGVGGGALIGGVLYDWIGPADLFRVASASAFAGLVVFVVTQLRQRAQPVPQQT
jgi:PPP family 3-phenylpropionic acid transporter